MLRQPSSVGIAALLASAGVGVASSTGQVWPEREAPVAPDAAVEEGGELWFVELASPPAVEGTSRETLKAERDAFRANAARAGVRLEERYAFETLFHGFSLKVSGAAVPTIARMSGVRAVWPVATVQQAPSEASPDLATALALTGADVAQSELGLTGQGIRVAVMDTGVDYHHPDLGGCFGPGCRVVTGWDLVGDAFRADGTAAQAIPRPDPDPDDCGGRGTHVAGIIGANGGAVGVAPNVRFGAYRVFGCSGSTFADVMIEAMERALADDMQVLNMSIGSAFQWPNYPTAMAADRLVNAGMVVVASIGNSGDSGLYAAGAPGLGKKVIGVASFDNSHTNATVFISSGGRSVGYLPLSVTEPAPTSGTSAPLVYLGRGCNGDPYLASPAGKVALIVRGTCTFNEKYQRAVAAGARGVIVHNNAPGIFSGGGVAGVPGIFGIGISLEDGNALRAELNPGPVTWTDETVGFPNPTGGRISSFSSFGLSPDLALKPDLGAPGGLIRSTLPLEQGGYGILSGTSMSAPHVAGAAALLLEARPNTPAPAVRTIFQNTANPRRWSGDPSRGLDHVHRQGAGMLDVPQAVATRARIEPSAVALGESEGGPASHTLRVANGGARP